MGAVRAEIDAYRPRYGRFLDEVEAEFEEFVSTGVMPRARELASATGEDLHWACCPQYFGGDLDGKVVLVHLNARHDDGPSSSCSGNHPFSTFEEYFSFNRHFGALNYGPASLRTHRSPFDHKQVRFLKELEVMDLVEERTREDRFRNLQHVIDDKLQLESIPYGSAKFRTHAFQRDALRPYLERIMGVITAAPRLYVLFCGVVFEPLLRDYVTRRHEFRLTKNDGTLCKGRSFFSNVEIPFNGRGVAAALCQSWPQQGIPMGAYGREVKARYEGA